MDEIAQMIAYKRRDAAVGGAVAAEAVPAEPTGEFAEPTGGGVCHSGPDGHAAPPDDEPVSADESGSAVSLAERPVEPVQPPSGQTQLAELVTPIAPKPPPRLSPSGAGTYEQCPRRWRFRYVDGYPDPPGEAALIGSFAHRVLEVFMQRPPAQRTLECAKAVARELWPELAADPDYVALGLDAEQSLAFRWAAWRAIEGLWRLEDPKRVMVAATEQDLHAELGGVPFRGIVDRLDKSAAGLIVTDYKSGKPPPPGFRRKHLDQVLLYSAAVAETTGEVPARARLMYLGRKQVGMAVTPADLHNAVQRLADTWHSIQTACTVDDFEPRPGPLCAWCAYAEHCPEGQAEIAARAERAARRDEQLEQQAALAQDRA